MLRAIRPASGSNKGEWAEEMTDRYVRLWHLLLPPSLYLAVQYLTELSFTMMAWGAADQRAAESVGVTSAVCIPAFIFLYLRWRTFPASRGQKADVSGDKNLSGYGRLALWCIAGAIAGMTLSAAWGALANAVHLDRFFSDASQRLYASQLWQQILFAGLLAPVCEELLFRGLLFGALLNLSEGERTAALLTSVLFALFHGNVIQMLYAFPTGLILQFLFCRGDSILPCVFFHIAANLTAVLVTAM